MKDLDAQLVRNMASYVVRCEILTFCLQAPEAEFDVGDTVSARATVGGTSRRVTCKVTKRQLQNGHWVYKLSAVRGTLEDRNAWYSESELSWP